MESQQPPISPREPSAGPNRRLHLVFVGIFILALAGAVLWWMGFGSYVVQRAQYSSRTATFSGDSASLTQTVIVPTLDTPCPPGKNVIWCSSLQLAWNELRDNVIKAPLNVIGAEETAARLNTAKQLVSDLDAKSVYARGGWVEKGIREQIRKDMAAKFPSYVLPDFNGYTEGILAYSYLTARAPFKRPFRQMDDGLAFTDSQGVQTQVAGFGLWETYRRAYKKTCEQVSILYLRSDNERDTYYEQPTEYALDLCRHSKPYQVVVARVDPRGSLAETFEHIHAQMVEFKKLPGYEELRRLRGGDELEVPDIFWRIDHRFTELIGRAVANVGMPIVEALQTIEFRFDRFGVALESKAVLAAKASPRYFEFNRPFLIYMQKRDTERPFFVMWVDNAELLTRR